MFPTEPSALRRQIKDHPLKTRIMETQKKNRAPSLLLVVGAGLGLLLLLAVLFAFFLAPSPGTTGRSFLSGDRIAIIPIKGEISSDVDEFSSAFSSREIADYVRDADKDPRVSAILLEINSPGGGVVASKEIAYAVYAAQKPVVAYIGDLGASGGYYVASAADYIVADEDSLTGSIGVIAVFPSLERFLVDHGINVQVLKRGRYKASGNLFEDMDPEERELFQVVLEQAYSHFRRDVLSFRPNLSEEQLDAVADGRILTGEQAFSAGLIDQTGSFDDAVAKAGELADTPGAEAFAYAHKEVSLFDILTRAGYSLGLGFQKGLTTHAGINPPQIKT